MEQESGHIDGQRGIVGRFHLFGLVDVIRYDQSESDQPVTLVPRLRELLLHLNIPTKGKKNKIRIAENIAITPPNLSGIERKIA